MPAKKIVAIPKPSDEVIALKPFCSFCKENGESAELYQSHVLRSPQGVVLCPILREVKCPICLETGDNAHTMSYCKLRKSFDVISVFGKAYTSNMVVLKRTNFSAAGERVKSANTIMPSHKFLLD